MPGAYAHLTVVHEASPRPKLASIEGFPKEAIAMCSKHLRFCELGAVSPDYPYLHVTDSASAAWADRMHHEGIGDFLKTAIAHIRTLTGLAQEKSIAWLLGFTAHVVADVTVHPVVNLKVGDYAQNKTQHRVCEMNQDVYIFEDRLSLEVTLADFLKVGIASCSNEGGDLDDDIRSLWALALSSTYPSDAAATPPRFDSWHAGFKIIVQAIGNSNVLTALARHIAPNAGLVYPKRKDVDMNFIEKLATPIENTPMTYDEIFDRAVRNVRQTWKIVANGALGIDDQYLATLDNWNLDTGKDPNGKLVFWEAP